MFVSLFNPFVPIMEPLYQIEAQPMAESNLHIDKDIESCLPALTAEEFAGLEAEILKDGCTDTIKIWREKNTIVDGHNRYKICQKHGIAFGTKAFSFPDKDHAILWALIHAVNHRNLPQFRNDEVKLRIKGLLEMDAKSRKSRKPLENEENSVPPNLAGQKSDITSGEVNQIIADISGSSRNNIRKVENVLKNGDESIKELARQGDISTDAAFLVASNLSKQEQEKIAKEGEKAVKAAAAKLRKNKKRGSSEEKSEDEASVSDERVILDKLGTEITDKGVRQAFIDASQIAEFAREVSSLKCSVVRAAKANPDTYSRLSVSLFEIDMNNAYRHLKSSLPYSLDPLCGGNGGIGNKCKQCQGLGWLTEQQYDALPKNQKKTLQTA
jgi:hypothetical protein